MKKLFSSIFILFVMALHLSVFGQSTNVTTTKDDIVKSYFSELTGYRYKPDQQSFAFETLSGETLFEHNADRASDPASVMKTATTLTAIAKLGADYRFTTKFYTNGVLNTQTGVLKGDLIVQGSGDPSFYSEDAFAVAQALNQRGVTKVEGNLIVTDDFYVNFDPYPQPSAETFKALIDPKLWDAQTRQAWSAYYLQTPPTTDAVGQLMQTLPISFTGVEITGKARVGSDVGALLLASHDSNVLSRILKEQNKYSNNIMAEMVGKKLGGLGVIERYLVNDLKLSPANVHIGSASGLYYSYLTPRDTLKIVRKLKDLLEARQLKLEDILPVQGLDQGTLSDRLTQESAGTLVGKTGTLTQSGVSALTGIIYTKSKGPVVFAIFNHGGNVVRFRKTQDDLLTNVIDFCGGAAPVNYMPPTRNIASRTR